MLCCYHLLDDLRARVHVSTAIGAGGLFGTIAISRVIIDSQLSFDVITLWCSVSTVLACIVVRLRIKKHSENQFREILSFAIFFLLALLIAASLRLPAVVHGWDSLQFWIPTAVDIYDFKVGGEPNVLHISRTHPLSLSAVIAWAVHASSQLTPHINLTWIWFLFSLSYVLSLYGFSRKQGNSRFICGVLSMASLSIPLAENHILIAGYADFPMGAALAVTVASLSNLLDLKWPYWLAQVLLGMLAIIALKGTGPFYCAAIFGSLITYFVLRRRYLPQVIFLCLFLLVFLGWVLANGLDVRLLGNRFGYRIADSLIFFGGQTLMLNSVSIADYSSIVLHSLFVNLSFSVLPILFLIIILNRLWHTASREFLSLPLLVIVFGFFGLSLSLFGEFSFNQSIPTHDVLWSRLLLPFVMLVPFLLAEELAGRRTQAVPCEHKYAVPESITDP